MVRAGRFSVGDRRSKRYGPGGWLAASVTPWAAGLGLLVSITATAGTDTSLGASAVPQLSTRIAPSLPPGAALIGASDMPWDRTGHTSPRGDLKSRFTVATVFPEPNRSGKGDAAVPPGPSFARAARVLSDGGASLFGDAASGRVTGIMAPGSAMWNQDDSRELGFVPTAELGLGSSAGTVEADMAHDGSTPTISRAVALSSTTPAPADATPVEVADANLPAPQATVSPEPERTVPDNARHRYADLIEPEALDKEQRCLAEAVYFEARSEPEEGQAAVAQVVLNRVKSGLYPTNVCGVVYQNRHRYMGCQFSFACEGKSLRISDGPSWQSASRIAKAVIEGRTYLSEVGGATHYHADYVRPGWSRRLKKMDVIGRHIFYSLKRGQT